MGVGMAGDDSRTTAGLLRAKRRSMPIITLLLVLIGLPSMFTWMLAAVAVMTSGLWTMREKLVGIFIPAVAHVTSAGMVRLLAPAGDSTAFASLPPEPPREVYARLTGQRTMRNGTPVAGACVTAEQA